MKQNNYFLKIKKLIKKIMKQEIPKEKEMNLTIGISLEPYKAKLILDMGPSADDRVQVQKKKIPKKFQEIFFRLPNLSNYGEKKKQI
jgi:hypothetical protein